jgi:hypothetical protein
MTLKQWYNKLIKKFKSINKLKSKDFQSKEEYIKQWSTPNETHKKL